MYGCQGNSLVSQQAKYNNWYCMLSKCQQHYNDYNLNLMDKTHIQHHSLNSKFMMQGSTPVLLLVVYIY
jgi:uncharacterized protein with NRDE domain